MGYSPPAPLNPSYKPSVRIAKLPASAPVEDIIEILDRDGGLIVEDLVSPDDLAQIEAETAPYVGKAGHSGFTIMPDETVLVGGLVGKSRTMAALCEHPHLVELRKRILTDAGDEPAEEIRKSYHIDPLLSISLSFRVGSGAPRQRLHRDDRVHLIDHSGPFVLNRVSQFGCLVAGGETTQQNGATMFVPGSHRWDEERQPKLDEVTFAGIGTLHIPLILSAVHSPLIFSCK
jgi:ectoine hydroxylase-related dioxygenase (phytanoyl-CoA dioxygenase family)